MMAFILRGAGAPTTLGVLMHTPSSLRTPLPSLSLPPTKPLGGFAGL